jgi:hypothetical protein
VALALPRQPKESRKPKTSGKDESLPAEFKELIGLVVTYARQQTIDPIKQLLRWVALGVAGAVVIGIGILFLGLGLLRAVQSEAGHHLTGHWSWVPYLIAVVFLGAVIALMVRRISQRPGSKEH